jgi:hypothetical protein
MARAAATRLQSQSQAQVRPRHGRFEHNSGWRASASAWNAHTVQTPDGTISLSTRQMQPSSPQFGRRTCCPCRAASPPQASTGGRRCRCLRRAGMALASGRW